MKCNRMKLKKNIIAGCILIILLCLMGIIWYFSIDAHKSKSVKIAKIYQNGKEIYSINLSAVEKPYEIEIDGKKGEKNIVLVEPGKISIKESNCPDQICVKAGAISNATLPIVCLPNHLLIKIEEKEEDTIDITTY